MATAPTAAGIMDLPENEDMNQAAQLSPMESYDAATTALNIASPDAAAQYEQTMNMSLPPELMEMSAEEIGQLLQLFQYLQDNPEEYPAAIAELVKDGIIDAGDLPPEYDDEVLATVSALLMQALKTKQGAMPQQPQGFAMGGIADAARIVANQGRGQDTMLAHITPEESQLLRSRGGMGTINPMTGLREFGFFKKIFKGVTKVVKAVVKPIVKVAKEIVSSPIGRIIATVALVAFLGPAAGAATGMLGLGAAGTAAVVSGGLTMLSGGDLKDALISGATAYFGAPGGPVSNFVGQAGISTIAGQAAAASALVGTAASLATGKNLKDSIKMGLTQAAISGGSAIVSNYMAQAGGSKSLMDAINKQAPVLTPAGVFKDPSLGELPALTDEDFRNLHPEHYDQVNGLPPGTAPATAPIVEAVPFGSNPGVDGLGSAPTNNVMDQYKGFGAALDGAQPQPVGDYSVKADYSLGGGKLGNLPTTSLQNAGVGAPPAGAYQPPGMWDSAKRMGSGIMDIGQGNFKQGFNDLTGGAGDLFMPSGPTPEQIQTGKLDAFSSAKASALARGMTTPEAEAFAKNALESYTPPDPGMIRSYAPLAAAGIGTLGLMGGFEPGEMPQSELKETLSGTPGMDLIRSNPNEYLVQNMRGVKYNPDGSFAGYETPSRSPTTNRGDPYAGFYAPRSRPNFGSQGRPRFAAQGGIMDARGYAEGGAVRGYAEGGYTSEELGKVAAYFATNPTPENILDTANSVGLSAQQLADLYNQAVPSAKDTPMTLDIINNALTTSGKTLDGGYVNYTPEQETKYNEFLASSPNLTGQQAYQFYDDNNLSLSQAAGLQSQASGDDFYTTKTNYDNFLASNGLSLGGGYTGGDLVYPGNKEDPVVPIVRDPKIYIPNTSNTSNINYAPVDGIQPITAPAQAADDAGYKQYYGGRNRINYPLVFANPAISAELPYQNYYSGENRVGAPASGLNPYQRYSTAYKDLLENAYSNSTPAADPAKAPKYDRFGRALFKDYEYEKVDKNGRPLFNMGGIAQLANGGYPRRNGQINGPGTEKSDSIPAMLSDGEFVMTAGAVRGAGNGSRRAGAKKMYALMNQLEQNAARG